MNESFNKNKGYKYYMDSKVMNKLKLEDIDEKKQNERINYNNDCPMEV